ncbi:MAG TPA: thioredoxin fold domain-containing protein [Acidobacteriota bacterium]|nr:thioredoxin fold domain-containing protein [Acidobacteriota bacterium]
MRTALILALLGVLMTGCGSDEPGSAELVWTDLAEMQAEFPQAPRPLFLYISQDNCPWCEQMESLILPRPEIVAYLNEHYIPVNINLDRDLPVTINDRQYTRRQLFDLLKIEGIPAYYFFDSTGQILGMMDSAMPLTTFKRLLIYVENRHFMRTPWVDFLKLPEADVDTAWGVF